MKRVSVGWLMTLFFVLLGGIVSSGGRGEAIGSDEQMHIALDLMELDIPGEGEGDQMDLPPMEEPERAAPEPNPPAPPQKPAAEEIRGSQVPVSAGSVPQSSPGMAPFLLEGADNGGGKGRAAKTPKGTYDDAVTVEELPTELKSVLPPSSRAETLKLPSRTEPGASGKTAVPETPLLDVEDRALGKPVSAGQDSSLTMKPLPDLYGTEAASKGSVPSRPSRRPEDYLQTHEDIDAGLIRIHERFYKNR